MVIRDYLNIPAASRTIRGQLIDTPELANAARIIRERQVNPPTPPETITGELHGYPDLYPGLAINATAASVEASGIYWLSEVATRFDESGCHSDITLHRFSGDDIDGALGLPAGADACTTAAVGSGTYHVGDNTVGTYAKPAPDGTTVTIPFTPATTTSSLSIKARAHSTTFSGIFDAGTSPTGQNRAELWQGGSKVGEAAIPLVGSLTEDMSGIDYTNDANWSDVTLTIGGSLTGGTAAELRLIAGHYALSGGGDWYDEYEIKGLNLESCVDGVPPAPVAPTPITIPPPSAVTLCDYTFAGPGTFGAGFATGFFTIVPGVDEILPANMAYIRITGYATDATGRSSTAATDGDITAQPEQGIYWTYHGQYRSPRVPGSQSGITDAELKASGTRLVGSGAFETWWGLSAPGGSATDVNLGELKIALFRTGGATPLTLSNLCITFHTTGPGA